MQKDQFKVDLLHFITKKLFVGKKKITPTTKLFAEGLVNSLKILDLIAFVEKKLQRRISDNDIIMNNFETAEAICQKFCQ